MSMPPVHLNVVSVYIMNPYTDDTENIINIKMICNGCLWASIGNTLTNFKLKALSSMQDVFL